MLTRRQFLHRSAAGLALPTLWQATPTPNAFYIGVIADSHVIDQYYKGPESNPEDSESIFKTSERLAAAREVLNNLRPALDKVFLVGDYFHDYPSSDLDFYFKNTTRIDHAVALTDGFRMPVHVGFGNHDYSVPNVSRESSHELFRRKLGVKPYYAVDHKGWKFIHLNNFLGTTWQAGHAAYRKQRGSLGEEQLLWLEAQLAERRPTMIFVHYPLSVIEPTEVADLGLHPLLKRHAATVQRVISGHWHRWVDAGREFGPPHLVIAATRYDEDAYLIVEIDAKAGTHRLLNLDLVEWNTHFSRPYVSA
ncbi:MAG: metallophosphoesterase [Acidobacteriota bacterium]|nr:metallophosphoesterase [Acidobacteriota bacterium]